MKRNETSELLSEIAKLALKNVDHTLSIPLIKKKSDVTNALEEVKSLVLTEATEEQEFINAKELAKKNFLAEEKRKADVHEQNKIAQMYHAENQKKHQFIASHVLEDTPPTPMPLFEKPNLFFQTQMIDIRQVNKAVNKKLLDQYKFHIIISVFLLSLGFFYATADTQPQTIKKSSITLPVVITEKTPPRRLRPLYIWPQNYVLQDNYSNVSQNAPDLTLNNLIYKSILTQEDTIEKKRGPSRVKRVKKIVKENKRFQFEVDINKSDLK